MSEFVSPRDRRKLDRAIDKFNAVAQEIADSVVNRLRVVYPDNDRDEIGVKASAIMNELLNATDDSAEWDVRWEVDMQGESTVVLTTGE